MVVAVVVVIVRHPNLRSKYLSVWFDILLTQRHWYKHKIELKLIDYLLAYTFVHELSINNDLFKKFLNCVYCDFQLNVQTSSPPAAATAPGNVSSNGASTTNTTPNEDAPPGGMLSNWLQPINWISSTLYAVGGVVSAGADTAQIAQQFSYDKRLYKDYSYIGFYLCLCGRVH